ncbi:hypothetical protein OROMI_009313 [Orobanche minor]
MMPILPSVLNANSPDELLEDSLQVSMGSYSFSCHLNRSSAIGFFPCLMEIMEKSFDHLELAASIIEGYIVLGVFEFFNMHTPTLARVLYLVVGNVNNKGLLSVLPLVDVIVQCFPAQVPQYISTIIQKLIVICLSVGNDRDPCITSVKTSATSILARFLVTDTNYLAQLASEPSLLAHLQKAGFANEENTFLCLVDVWLDKVKGLDVI